jgi:hypothetical protein
MELKGKCYCGQLEYDIDGDLQACFQCHCRECQYITGGNPNAVMVFSQEDFKFTKGDPSIYSRKDLETPVNRYFCSTCGTGIGSISPSRPGSFIVKVGTLDAPEVFDPKFAIFTCDKQDFHHIPSSIDSFDKRPPKRN